MIKSVTPESSSLDKSFGLSDHAWILPSSGNAEDKFHSLRLPPRKGVRKTFFEIVMETSKKILIPLPRLFEPRGVRPWIGECRIQVQFEIADTVSALLITQKSPAFDCVCLFVVLKKRWYFVRQFVDHFSWPMLHSLRLRPIRPHGVGNSCPAASYISMFVPRTSQISWIITMIMYEHTCACHAKVDPNDNIWNPFLD